MIFLPLANNTLDFGGALGISGLGLGIVMAVLAALAVFVIILSKIVNAGKKKNSEDVTEQQATTQAPVAQATQSNEQTQEAQAEATESDIPHIPGFVVLDGVSEQDAAVLMAITAHRTSIPLERLDFKSIKRLNQDPVLENVEEQDAAVLMAIVSNKTGIPLEKLAFNSIKLVG